MVSHTRAAARAHRLRPLNQARPIRVEVDESGDDEWWRREVSRLYFSLLLEDGRVVTIYRDLVTGRWSQQNYG